MISECHRFCIELMENRESGWNPERYRHCMRGGTAHDESRSLGVNPEKAVRKAYDTQVRRPAQVVKVYLLLSYGEMGYFVAKKRQQQSCMTAAFCIPENHALDAWFKRAFGDEGDKKLLLLNKSAVWQMHLKSKRREFRMSLNDINNLSYAKWNYKYHIVFAPRYRRKVFYKEKRAASNNPRAAGRPYYTFTRYARNRGLCLHRKNPQFYWGVTFAFSWLKPQKDIHQWRKEK